MGSVRKNALWLPGDCNLPVGLVQPKDHAMSQARGISMDKVWVNSWNICSIPLASQWLYILVQMKKILWIIFLFYASQSVIIHPIAFLYPGFILLHCKVYITPSAPKRFNGIVVFLGPILDQFRFLRVLRNTNDHLSPSNITMCPCRILLSNFMCFAINRIQMHR